MKSTRTAIIVGGGFYGCSIAVHLAEKGWRVTLFEREPDLMTRASFVNQARLHNGYHYPRSFQTAIRSRANLPVFRDVYAAAVQEDFRALYAISRFDSKVNAQHFQRFCQAVGIPLRPARKSDRALFSPQLVQAVYEVDEPAFDAKILRDGLISQIARLDVNLHMNAAIAAVEPAGRPSQELIVRTTDGDIAEADWVFNCTYAALNHIDGREAAQRPSLRHQIAEIALFEPPEPLANLGVTLMDGPFFSLLPFPARKLHSLTHVRYTHHLAWTEGDTVQATRGPHNPLDILSEYLESGGGRAGRSRIAWMIRDAQRYLPALANAKIVDTLFDIKTLVTETQIDDARPIYFHRDGKMPGLISILGGKIDNIFDILAFIDGTLDLQPASASARS